MPTTQDTNNTAIASTEKNLEKMTLLTMTSPVKETTKETTKEKLDIPVIDISCMLQENEDLEEIKKVAAKVKHAMETVGFFMIEKYRF